MKRKITVAVVTKPYGNRGWIKVQGYSECVHKFFENRKSCSFRVGNEEKTFQLADVESIEGTPSFAIKLDGVDTIDMADMFRGFEIVLPPESVRKIDSMDSQSNYIGWKVIFSSGIEGIVNEMLDSASGEFIKVELNSPGRRRKEILVPFNDDFVSEINNKQKELKITRIECPYEF